MNELIAYIAPAAPELFVFAGACLLLVIDVFLPASRRDVTYWLAQALLAGAIVVTWQGLDGATAHAYHHMYVTDRLAELLKLVIYGLTMFAFAHSAPFPNFACTRGRRHRPRRVSMPRNAARWSIGPWKNCGRSWVSIRPWPIWMKRHDRHWPAVSPAK